MSAIINSLPNSSYPKPGEDVIWFSRNRKIEGKLIGYDIDEKPVIINQFGIPDSTNSFEIIRPKFPNERIQPNWHRLPTQGKLIKADEILSEAINIKLSERIPPGPSYLELISEIYFRGYETYLVGGTVRDFLQGEKSNDVDLVTTMPLKSAIPLIKSMFNDKYSYKKENGFIRIGGTPASGDPFIDVKNFTLCNSGYGTTLFGSEIEHDLRIRDFACNAIYYDTINKQILDPSGHGIDDAKDKNLTVVKDLGIHSPYFSSAQILIRLIKFSIRGYLCSTETLDLIKREFSPLFSTMTTSSRMRYISAQVLSKLPQEQKQIAYNSFVIKMEELGFADEYVKYIKPYEKLLNLK